MATIKTIESLTVRHGKFLRQFDASNPKAVKLEIMTKITLTESGRYVGTAKLFDLSDAPLWEFLELMFPDARTITRSNAGWSVEIPQPQRYA